MCSWTEVDSRASGYALTEEASYRGALAFATTPRSIRSRNQIAPPSARAMKRRVGQRPMPNTWGSVSLRSRGSEKDSARFRQLTSTYLLMRYRLSLKKILYPFQ
jgi:hypothetical protein